MHLHSYHSADISERSVELPSKRERETSNDSCWNCTFQPLLYYRIIIVKKMSCRSADQVLAFSGHAESLSNMALKQNSKQYAVNKHVFRLQEKNGGTIEGSYVSRVHRITKACCEGRTRDERLSTHPVHTKPLIDPKHTRYSRRDLERGIYGLDSGLVSVSFTDQEEEEKGLISTTVQMLLQVIKH